MPEKKKIVSLIQHIIVSSSKLRADTSRLSPTIHPSALDQIQYFPAKSIFNNDLAISSKQQLQEAISFHKLPILDHGFADC